MKLYDIIMLLFALLFIWFILDTVMDVPIIPDIFSATTTTYAKGLPPPVEDMSRELCDRGGGFWNTCGSTCEGGFCVGVCENTCDCGGIDDLTCPAGYTCYVPKDAVHGWGWCEGV